MFHHVGRNQPFTACFLDALNHGKDIRLFASLDETGMADAHPSRKAVQEHQEREGIKQNGVLMKKENHQPRSKELEWPSSQKRLDRSLDI